jgi:hypothetical protein
MKRSIVLASAVLLVGTLATPASASGAGWSITPSPNPRVATGQLFWESCAAATSCMAVGTHVKTSGVGVTLAERWNGSRWRIQPTPSPRRAAVSSLWGVSCTAPSSCMAVGVSVSQAGASQPLAERWDGTRWRLQPTPNPAQGGGFLYGVACTSPSACTAVGFSSAGTLAERWDGTAWRIEPTPNPSQGGGILYGVACTSASSCTAVGGSGAGTLAERWNGRRWRIQPTPNPAAGGASLYSVACSSRSACAAVGASNAGNLAERWNGTRWTIQRTPNPAGAQFPFLNTVACPSASACTAAGAYRNRSGTYQTLAERWDGTRWRIQPTPSRAGGSNYLFGVACTAASACTAAGFSVGRSGIIRTLSERWNGSRWRIQPTPSRAGAAPSQFASVACTSPSACTATGEAANKPLAERWDGAKWRLQHTPAPPGGGFLAGVSCTSAVACTAVGRSHAGTLAERWDGTAWRIQPTPNPPGGGGLFGVACTSASSCTAVGGSHAGTLAERWDGTRWRIQPTPNPRGGGGLQAVSCTSPHACTAVGGSHAGTTLAERWNGTSWVIQPTPKLTGGEGSFFNGVACKANACTAVGLYLPGTGPRIVAERWDGTAWRIQPTPKIPGAYDIDPPAVACPSPVTCMAAGSYSNDGPRVTLTEQWIEGGSSAQPTTSRPVASGGPASACARAVLLNPLPAGEQTPASPWHWPRPETSSTPASAAWPTQLPWCRAG